MPASLPARLLIAAMLTMPPTAAMAGPSPYAGEQAREIKALSPDRADDLLAGRGIGYAKAAELNGYPGPMHAMELAGPLGLTLGQTAGIEDVQRRMAEDAKRLGAELVEAERRLDRMFADGTAAPAGIDRTTAEAGEIEARLRAVHLRAHLETRAMLSAEQTATYVRLRGYAPHSHGHARQH